MNKYVKHGIYILLIFSIFTLVYIEYLMFFQDNPPVVFKEEQVPAVVVGDKLITTATVCRYTKVPVTIYASYVDGLSYSLPPEQYVGKEIGCSTNSRAYNIPETIEDGTYYLSVRNVYEVNAFATRIVEWRTVSFEINRTNK